MPLDELNYLVNGLAILLPGFIFIKVLDYFTGHDPFRDNFEFSIWSSFISIVIYLVASSTNEYLSTYFGFKNLTITLFAVFFFFLITCLFAERMNAFDKIRNYIFSRLKYGADHTVWDAAISNYYEYVIVFTSDGLKYGGQILLSTNGLSKKGEPIREIFLHKPIILNNDIELHEQEKNLQGVLLLDNDIKRIEFLGKIKYQTK